MPTIPQPTGARAADNADIAQALRAAVRGEVATSTRVRAEYTTDASTYRVVPQVVVFPRDTDDLIAVTEVARSTGTPLTLRGGGTSIAGNAIGSGIVVDTSRHLTAIGEIDPEARTAVVEPGVIMSSLQEAAQPFGLRFGPDPSTTNRATFGGMIGNNACGPRAVAYGRTVDNVIDMDVVDGLGRRYTARSGEGSLDPVHGLSALVDAHLSLLRTELGRFSRQVSGYSLEHLLPENGANLAKMLVGTEGTLATVLGATLSLVPIPDAAVLVVLGYESMPHAADAIPAILAHSPLAVEGMDARLVEVVRRHRGAAYVPEFPAGAGWLMAEMGGDTLEEALAKAKAVVADSAAVSSRVLPPGPEASLMWKIRADGAGLGGRTPDGKQGWAGWEDAAVPPAKLGAYLRDFQDLMAAHGVDGLTYGHFGDGCVHVRIGLPLNRPADVPGFRTFMFDAAKMLAKHGGSVSGEHGDGRARSELLPLMYSTEALEAFAAVKHLFDPANILNPGMVVDPRPLDADLRRPHAHPLRAKTGFSFRDDDGDFTTAVHRCTGIAKCRTDTSDVGDFMCPSFQATGDEKDSTRGRARVLQELTNGTLITGGWRSPEVREALDLCLSCKACSSECPTGIDMARYKSEVLHRVYRKRLRPANHYVLGWLPRWTRLVSKLHMARFANAALGVRPLARVVLAVGGLDKRRSIPRFATTSFRTVWAHERAKTDLTQGMGEAAGASASRAADGTDPVRRVVLWPDSFSDSFDPDVPLAMIKVLQDAGYEVIVPAEDACCGLTWISTGQLEGARKRLVNLLGILGPFAVNGIPIVGVEPSCTALLRSDLVDLIPDDPRAVAVAHATRTLAELLTGTGPEGPGGDWTPPSLAGTTVVAQPHCHQHSVMGYEADLALLRTAGAEVKVLAGCCGLAGNFGMERGHYEVSVKVAENALLPALREMAPGTVFLADGFSCRTQADDLADVTGMHLAQLLASHLS